MQGDRVNMLCKGTYQYFYITLSMKYMYKSSVMIMHSGSCITCSRVMQNVCVVQFYVPLESSVHHLQFCSGWVQ